MISELFQFAMAKQPSNLQFFLAFCLLVLACASQSECAKGAAKKLFSGFKNKASEKSGDKVQDSPRPRVPIELYALLGLGFSVKTYTPLGLRNSLHNKVQGDALVGSIADFIGS